jgi:hypothetical protein
VVVIKKLLAPLAALSLSVVILTPFPANALSLPAIDGESSDISKQAFAQIGTCLSAPNAQLNVLFVLDASSSLPLDTDKNGVRGDILAQAISQLDVLTETRPVSIAISSFDLTYREQTQWENLNEKTSQQLRNQIPGWVNGWWGAGGGTNWETALSGGAQTMQESPQSKSACKMIIWLTDGGINVDGLKDKSVNAAAMENICGTNPVDGERVLEDSLVAQLRSSNVHLIGVLLKSEEYLDSLDPVKLADEISRFSYMLPVTEGSGTVNNAAFAESKSKDFLYECGNVPVPKGHALGALLSGSSPISLAFAFADLGNGIRSGEREDLGDEFPVTFDIEKGINAATIQLAGKSWSLKSPNGSIIQTGTNEFVGAKVSQEGDLASIRLEGEALPAGIWTLDVKDSLASAVIYREIRVAGILVSINPPLQSAEESSLIFEFRDEVSDKLVPTGVYKTGDLLATFTQGQLSPTPLECRPEPNVLKFTCSAVPNQVGEATVSASFELSTESSSIRYSYAGQFTEEVAPSAAFPSVSTTAIELTDLIGKNGVATGIVTLKGPLEGTGEICLPGSADTTIVSDVIDRAESFTLIWGNESPTCVSLEQGEEVAIALSIRSDVVASSEVTLSLPFVLKSSDSNNELAQDVNATFITVREGTPNPFILLGLILIGFGIPVTLLYLQARSASRLSLMGLQVANIPVKIATAGDIVRITRATPGGGEMFQVEDWNYFSSSVDKARSYLTSSGVKLVAKTPRNPLGPLSAIAEAPIGSRVISSEGGATDGEVARVGLLPANQWVLSVSTAELLSDSEEFTGQLIAFANPSGGALEEANRELSLSAQDGMLLGSLLTVRDRIRAEGVKPSKADGQESESRRTKKDKATSGTPSTAGAVNDIASTPDSSSPFDSLFESDSGSTRPTAPDTKPQSPEPPKKSDGGTNNPFENL